MPHLLQATVRWRQRGASASEDENATKRRAFLSVGFQLFQREHHVFGVLEVLQAGSVCLLPTAGLKVKLTAQQWLKAKRKTGVLGEKTVPMPLYTPQIPHRLTRS
jgi:hypothetical protein